MTGTTSTGERVAADHQVDELFKHLRMPGAVVDRRDRHSKQLGIQHLGDRTPIIILSVDPGVRAVAEVDDVGLRRQHRVQAIEFGRALPLRDACQLHHRDNRDQQSEFGEQGSHVFNSRLMSWVPIRTGAGREGECRNAGMHTRIIRDLMQTGCHLVKAREGAGRRQL
ncbi:MAG: hypothetical protein R3B90_11725 [Planctomycetaceae bacterium]